MIYEPYCVVTVPFPFTDKDTQKKRPALIISSSSYQENHNHAVLLMITSAKHSSWNTDIIIQNLKEAGLCAPSIIRMKVFTLDMRLILEQKGFLSKRDQEETHKVLRTIFSF